MDAQLLVEVIAAPTSVALAAFTYWLTKRKEREDDWRKWKYEQYKEFLTALGENAGPPNPEAHRGFLKACNTLNLIGSVDVILALQSLIASQNADNPREENNARISKLIREIRKDLGVPGTANGTDFSARLWYYEERSRRNSEVKPVA